MRLIFTLIVGVICGNASACLVKDMPGDADNFPTIVYGRVSGVQLTQTESAYLGTIKAGWSDLTEAHTIRVIPGKYIKGKQASQNTAKVLELKINKGCGILLPQVLDEGLFFIAKDGTSAIPLYSKEGNAYAQWAYKLKLLD